MFVWKNYRKIVIVVSVMLLLFSTAHAKQDSPTAYAWVETLTENRIGVIACNITDWASFVPQNFTAVHDLSGAGKIYQLEYVYKDTANCSVRIDRRKIRAGSAREGPVPGPGRRTGAEGVIFASPSFCGPALLDRPMLQHVLADAGIPYIAFMYAENSGQMQPIREQAGMFADAVKLWSGQ